MKLKKDIPYLMNRNKFYARAGDKVQMIGAILVMTEDGSKFSVRAEDLEESGGDSPPDSSKPVPEDPQKKDPVPPVTTPISKSSKANSKQDYSPTLF